MNGYMNIRVKMLTGTANAQLKALRENIEKFDVAFKSVKKTSSGMGQIKVIGAEQIKRMREGNVAVNQLAKNFKTLRTNMETVSKTQATIANRQYVGKNQIANVQAMNTEIKMLTANLRVYKVVSQSVSKVNFVSTAQTAALAKMNTALETVTRNQAQVSVGAAEMSRVSMVSAGQQAEVVRLKTELQGVRRAMAAAQVQAARGAATGAAGTRPTASGAGATRGTTAATRGMDGYTASARRAQSAMVPTGIQQSRMVKWGSQLQWAGRQLQYNFTLPILAAAGIGMKFALDQEKAMTHVSKVYGDAADAQQWYMTQHGQSATAATATVKKVFASELSSLDNYFTSLSEYFATNKTEVLEVAGAWAAAGASGKELAESVKNTLYAASIGDMSTGEATKALISIQAQYGENAKGLARDLAYLNSVENATGAGMQDLIVGFQKAAGVARTGGIDVRHLAANIAALTPAAGGAAEAGNGLKSLIATYVNPLKSAQNAFKNLGIATESVAWQNLNVQERLIETAKRFKGLTSSQKAQTAAQIASKWQFNRFDTLMKELISTTGFYSKALNSTSSETKSLATAQNELDTILKSNPTSLKRVGVALQNSMADIVQPLIPAIISLATTVSDLTRGFQNLPAPVQKAAMYLAIFLVILPLMLRYIGAVSVLFGYLGVAAVRAGGMVMFFSRASMSLLRFPFAAVAGLWSIMMTAIGAVVGGGWRLISFVWSGGMMGLMSKTLLIGRGIIGLFPFIMAAISTIVMGGWKAIIVKSAAVVVGAFTSPWIIAVAAVAGILYIFRDNIRQIWNNIMQSFDGGYLQEIFVNMINNIVNAFHSLPMGIQSALIATVNMVRDAAMQVYEWFSYLNPWAHHSPSLVENVKTGMKAVITEFSSLNRIQKYIKGAYRTMADFGKATADFLKKSRAAGEAGDRQSIQKGAGKDAAGKYDKLIGKLHVLEGVYDKLGNRIAKMEDALVLPMARAEEAIWKNNYAQKQLQLQIALTEKKYGNLADAKKKLEAMNAEQAGLSEISTGLRQAGAGSDITGSYDQQIKAIEAQKKPLDANINKLDQLQKKLDELAKIGNILDLQKSVDFDPALHSIDQAKEKYDAVGTAIDRIKASIQEVVQAQSAMDSALNKKKSNKKKGTEAGGAGAGGLGAGGNYAKVGGKGIPARVNWESQSKEIDKMTDDLIKDAGKRFGDINPFKSLSKWFKKELDKIRGYLPDGKKIIDAVFGGGDNSKATAQLDDLGKKIGSVGGFFRNAGTVIGKVGKALWDFFGPELVDMFNGIKDGVASMWKIIGPELAAWARDLAPIAEGFLNIAAVVASALGVAAKVILGIVGGALKPLLIGVALVFRGISKIVRGVFLVIAGVVNFFSDLFRGNFDDLGKDLKNIWTGIWTAISGVFDIFFGVVVGIVGGLIGAIVGLFKSMGRIIMIPINWVVGKIVGGFKWLYNVLVGHSIIPDMVNAIVGWFKTLASIGKWIWNHVLVPIWNFFISAKNKVVEIAKGFWNAIVSAWDNLKGAASWIWNNVLKPIPAKFKSLWSNHISPFLKSRWDNFKNNLNKLKGAPGWFWNNVLKPIPAKFKSLWTNHISPFLKGRWTNLKSNLSALTGFAKWVWDKALKPVYQKFKDLFENIGTWLKNNVGKIANPMITVINKVLSVVNKMIDGLNILDKLPGIKFKISHIPDIKKMADGGQVPTRQARGGFKTNGARAIVGEGKANHPEYVIPTDPTYRNRAHSLMGQLTNKIGFPKTATKKSEQFEGMGGYSKNGSIPMFFGGGILDGIKDAAGGVKNAAKNAGDFAKGNLKKIATTLYKPFGALVDKGIKKIGWDWARKGATAEHGQVKNWIGAADKFQSEVAKSANVGGGGKWQKPIRRGYTLEGGIGSYPGHNGQDIGAPIGTPVHAINGGKVTKSLDLRGAGNSGGYRSYGRYIQLSHPGGVSSLYAHNSLRSVQTGENVKAGDVISRSGQTGNTNYPHLHLSIWKDGALQQPLSFLKSHGVKMAEGGIATATRGGVSATIAEGGQDELVAPLPRGFNIGDLATKKDKGGDTYQITIQSVSFPNITGPDDAQKFLDNLEAVVKD